MTPEQVKKLTKKGETPIMSSVGIIRPPFTVHYALFQDGKGGHVLRITPGPDSPPFTIEAVELPEGGEHNAT